MKDEMVTDALVREFLLGNVDDEQRQQIESLFLTDSQTRERVLAVEQDLIEDYLEGSLTTADRERFVSRYAQTDEQRRKLRITKSIKDWAVTEAASTQIAPVKTKGLSSLSTWLRLRPVFVVPIAVTIVIAIVVGAVWLSQRERLAIERELVQFNTPASLSETPEHMLSETLSSGAARGDEREKEIKKLPDTEIVELRLRWVRKERYSTYKVEIRRMDDDPYTIPNVEPEDDGKTIRIRLPAHMFPRGTYVIRVTGITPDGSFDLIEDYQFAMGD